MTDTVVRLITEIVTASMVRLDEPMSRHTTFKIGGPADLLVEPSDTNQIKALIKLFKQLSIPYIIIGNGSNILVGDKGIRGAVIKLGNQFAKITADEITVTAYAGAKLSKIASVAYKNALTGMEFAAGIPGSFGGALYMNAGAYGGEMKQIVADVTYMDSNGESRTVSCDECLFGYRTSLFEKESGNTILCGTLRLSNGNAEEIKTHMDDLAQRRISKQPLNFPSAGSTFKRPEGAFAGKLIQDAGLMGERIGGAEVSQKHAGFIINRGGATAADVRALIALVQERVKECFGYELMPEVRFVGEF